jgi:hypothetical protein
VSSSNQLTFSLCLLASIACASTERAEVRPRTSLQEDRAELERREAYLASKRDSTIPVAGAVLRNMNEKGQPAVGMAMVEVSPGGLALEVSAELEEGVYRVYLGDERRECEDAGLDLENATSFGFVDNGRRGGMRFERRPEDGLPSFSALIGRPLVLVHPKNRTMVCGVIREL